MSLMSSDARADGRLEQADGQWQVRFTRAYAHPRDRVWRAVPEAGHLAAWFPQRITGEWAPGAELVFADPKGRGPDFTGEVLRCKPPELLEFRWGTDVLRFELAETGGGCTLTLLDILAGTGGASTLMLEDLPAGLGTAARSAAGWHECLDRLACELAGQPVPFAAGERWAEVYPGYVATFGPEASAIGPPPGYEPTAP
jgi:uncharacterized protein YndB with AHSA1/START domain